MAVDFNTISNIMKRNAQKRKHICVVVCFLGENLFYIWYNIV